MILKLSAEFNVDNSIARLMDEGIIMGRYHEPTSIIHPWISIGNKQPQKCRKEIKAHFVFMRKPVAESCSNLYQLPFCKFYKAAPW